MGKEQFEEMDEEMTVELELDDGSNVPVPSLPFSK